MTLASVLRRVPLHLLALMLLLEGRALLRVTGLRRTLSLVAAPGRQKSTPAPPERLLRAVRRVSRLIPRSTCLAQSLALAGLLVRQGDDCDVVLGCWRNKDEWTAHAWVESSGQKLEPVYGGAQTEIARCTSKNGWILRPVQSSQAV